MFINFAAANDTVHLQSQFYLHHRLWMKKQTALSKKWRLFSVLARLLFNIYTHGLLPITSKLYVYADDLVIVYPTGIGLPRNTRTAGRAACRGHASGSPVIQVKTFLF